MDAASAAVAMEVFLIVLAACTMALLALMAFGAWVFTRRMQANYSVPLRQKVDVVDFRPVRNKRWAASGRKLTMCHANPSKE